MENFMQQKCGYILFLGLPNAGKSTLLNKIIGQKIAAVSRKRETTRHQTLGVLTEGESQFIFMDVPGVVHGKSKDALSKGMKQLIQKGIKEADVICFLVDGSVLLQEADKKILQELKTDKPVIPVLTKIDSVKKFQWKENLESLQSFLKTLDHIQNIKEPLVISAKQDVGIAEFKKSLSELLPEGEWHFSEDEVTNRPIRFLISEFVREQVMRNLGKEVPYQVSVMTDHINEGPSFATAFLSMYISRASLKPMILGKNGHRIQTIREESEKRISELMEKEVKLSLQVKVKSEWPREQEFVGRYLD
jgi:GTP-binding protein Era